jgi:hypothetical protein
MIIAAEALLGSESESEETEHVSNDDALAI